MTFKKLFEPPYSEKIQKVLPTLFNMVELENRRGKRLEMEVGTARERVLIALFMYAFGKNQYIKLPAHGTNPCGVELSAKALRLLMTC